MANVITTGAELLDNAKPARPRGPWRRLLVWTIGIIVIGGMLVAVFLPSLCRSSETANRVKCASNLRQIGQAILAYTQSNGGHYPPSLAVLPASEDITAEVMTCPSSNESKATANTTAGVVAELTAAETNAPGHENCLSYVYAGQGLTVTTAAANAIVAYEPLTNHNGDGTNVLFGDGHVEFIGKQAWPRMLAESVKVVLPSSTRP